MLKKVAADFVKAEVPAHQMTQWYKNKQTFQPQLIKKAAELGWLGMMLPEEFGGAGVSTMDCAVVFEELGHGPVPGPLFTSGILSAQMIFEAGTDEQRKALLPPLCAGTSIVVPAHHRQSRLLGTGSGRDAAEQNSQRLPHERRQTLRLRRPSRHQFSLRRAHGRGQSGFLARRCEKPRHHRHAAHRLFCFRRRSELRQSRGLVGKSARLERRELVDAGICIGQVAADSFRLSSRRHPRSLRHHLRVHHARAWSSANRSAASSACKITASISRSISTWRAGRLTKRSGASTAAWTRAPACTKPRRPPATATITGPITRTWFGPDREPITATR